LLVEHFPKSDPYLYGPIVAVRLRANLEAHSWTNERPVMTLTSAVWFRAARPLPESKPTKPRLASSQFDPNRKLRSSRLLQNPFPIR
jgi:hypothetical protein